MLDTAHFHAALGRGDHRSAATWLVRAHASDVLSLCRAIVRDRHAAEDLAQDTFASAFGGLPSLRLESAPRAWLLSIARNRCIDHLRRTKRSPYGLANDVELVELHPDDDAPLGPELLQRREDVVRALGVLDEAARALVMLRFRHGLEYGELAEVFGQKEGTIRMRLSRALSRMREELGDELEAELDAEHVVEVLKRREAIERAPIERAPGAPTSSAGGPTPLAPRRPAAAPPPASAPAGPPPPSRARRIFGTLFRTAAPPSPPAPEPTSPFARWLAELDEPSAEWLAQLETLAARV